MYSTNTYYSAHLSIGVEWFDQVMMHDKMLTVRFLMSMGNNILLTGKHEFVLIIINHGRRNH